jgi:hypothetical protein
VKVSCAECRTLFEAKTRSATFCGVKCRQVASRRDREARAEGELAPVASLPSQQPETTAPAESELVTTTRRELEDAGVADTVHGQIALRLAQKLAQPGDTGSAMASLARQLSAAVAEALAGGTKKTDAIDELEAWRLKKASGA